MAYSRVYPTKVDWKDYPNIETPITASNLDKMDQAILDIDKGVSGIETNKADKTEIANTLESFDIDEDTGDITITRHNGTTIVKHTNLTKITRGFHYNAQTQQIEITAMDGTVEYVDISAFITETEFVDGDSIAFSVVNHKVTATIKAGSITDNMLESKFLENARNAAGEALASKNAAEAAALGIQNEYQDVISNASQVATDAAQVAADRAQTGKDAAQTTADRADITSKAQFVQQWRDDVSEMLSDTTDLHAEVMMKAAQALLDALKAEGYATGKQNGVDQTTGEYYQNNAKYYADICRNAVASLKVDFSEVTLAQYNSLASPDKSTVYYITDKKYLIYNGISYGVPVTPVNNLTSSSTTSPLSANMGRDLREKIEAVDSKVGSANSPVKESLVIFRPDGSIKEKFKDGSEVITIFNSDGTIDTVVFSDGKELTYRTSFLSDGNIETSLV